MALFEYVVQHSQRGIRVVAALFDQGEKLLHLGCFSSH
jgi:hypothetical protein